VYEYFLCVAVLGILALQQLRHYVQQSGVIRLSVFLLAGLGVCNIALAEESDLARQPAALDYTGTYSLRELEPELTGADVVIAAVCRSFTYVDRIPQDDYRLNMGHNCFGESNVAFADGLGWQDGISGHSTAIGAILVGSDPNGSHPETGSFMYEGACPEAELDVYEFWRFVSGYVFGGKEVEADIITMSVGEVFEDWWTRGIERIAEEQGLVVVAAIGNGTNVYDPVLYPAAGENVIGVGVVDSIESDGLLESLNQFSLPHIEHTSSGPTYDERSKPDIVAPGNCLIPSVDGKAGYEISGNWSSFSTPIVTGTISLLIQQAKSEPDLEAAAAKEGGNCVMKAIVMNSATKLPYWHKGAAEKSDDHKFSLDYLQGAGVLNTVRAHEQLTAGQEGPGKVNSMGWDSNVIEKDQETANVYRIEVPEAGIEYITATLVWNKHYEDEYPFNALPEKDSDLRLEIRALDENEPGREYVLDYSDSANDNVEHIYCAADPNYSVYEIVVMFGEGGVGGDNERYALAWNIAEADSKDNMWWYDLNEDGKIDNFDHLVFAALENLEDNKSFLTQALKLSEERSTLLLEYKDYWKQFWNRWE
jgi:hypothetical protein